MSIVRVGLAETKKFADGYDAIFTKKRAAATQASDKPAKKKAKPSKKKAKKR